MELNGQNLMNFIKTRPLLTKEDQNNLVKFHNQLMNDKKGKQMFLFIMSLVNQRKLSGQEAQSVCSLSRSWPNAFE
jgi:hypothetical protein